MPDPAIVPLLQTPMALGESPVWHSGEQALYWIDIAGKAIHCYQPAAEIHRYWSMPAEPGCIGLCAAGGLIVALRSGIFLLDTERGALDPVAGAPYDQATLRFNDGRCDGAGRFWAGTLYEPRDRPAGPVYCVERGKLRDSGLRASVSNGLAFSLDNRTLYHADTTAHRIMAYDFDLASGMASNGRVFQQFSADKSHDYGGRPDGAVVDSEGAYWVAMYEGGRILRFAPSGELLREIALPLRCPTMAAFGGPDLRTLYITSARRNRSPEELARYPHSGCVLALRVETPGREETRYLR